MDASLPSIAHSHNQLVKEIGGIVCEGEQGLQKDMASHMKQN
jgi:hypothetical protein